MKRSILILVVGLLGASLLATVSAAAAPMSSETEVFKAAVDETFQAWADHHLNTLGAAVYDRYEHRVDAYQVAGDVGWARGTYTIVTRARRGGAPYTNTGVFQTMFEKQADGSWDLSTHTTIPRPE